MTDAVLATNVGWPRMGPHRELKRALERHWAGTLDEAGLLAAAGEVRQAGLRRQRDLGLDLVPTGDAPLYDHVLGTAVLVGAVPDEVTGDSGSIDLAGMFALARGGVVPALEMTKWFDTNYHYLVPELSTRQRFRKTTSAPAEAFTEAATLGIAGRPVLLGPVSFLLLAKGDFDPLTLLPSLVAVYEEVLAELAGAGADWVQVDEPALALDLDPEVLDAYGAAYARLSAAAPLRLLVATYFGGLGANLPAAVALPVAGLHLDCVRDPGQLDAAVSAAPESLALSAGVVDGRNVWRADLPSLADRLARVRDAIGPERLMVAPSCSLLHLPVDVAGEPDLDPEVRPWLAFAAQRIEEVVTLARALSGDDVAGELRASGEARAARAASRRVTDPDVRERVAAVVPALEVRPSPYAERRAAQEARLHLPPLPTTTIGSFPQTREVRSLRARHRSGELDDAGYRSALQAAIADAVRFQENVGLDVLVHGEFERNDMVEYFGEHLDGCLVTTNGWVQSYGSRCVKPPVVFGDVSRPAPVTVEWTSYAQSLTDRPVKGMLTGPVTMLQWSFVRDDQPEADTALQIALAIRDEVADLEAAGTAVIQVDEPALREGLPLRVGDRAAYLDWAVRAFRVATGGPAESTQVHTHMCYGEFADVLDAIVAFDADVISIETARSRMELLATFAEVGYPSGIGPGVWDIHSPAVPGEEEMASLLGRALDVFGPGQLWVNPDCGLKTRKWDEVEPALTNLVAAAHRARTTLQAL